jgi:hypothetical protein
VSRRAAATSTTSPRKWSYQRTSGHCGLTTYNHKMFRYQIQHENCLSKTTGLLQALTKRCV